MSKKKHSLAGLLYNDRFSGEMKSKKYLQRNSITEYTGLSALNEKLIVENKHISCSKDLDKPNSIVERYFEQIQNLNYNLSIPPRVPHVGISAEDYKIVESYAFNAWKYEHRDLIFEKNIEIWRQFWLTCERADTIAQIVDSRNPNFFVNEDILTVYPKKNHVILCNKFDLVDRIDPVYENVYRYSALDNSFDYKLEGTVGLIGYPNVGKSSTINLILRHKKVRVSSTPGKTKYIQTIETPKFTLLDCPGLVFPKHSKVDLIMMGILNIDQITDLQKYEKYIIEFIGDQKICDYYKLKAHYNNAIEGISKEKGWVKSKCLKILTKDFALGNIRF